MMAGRIVVRALLLWMMVAAPAWPHEVRPVALGIVERGALEYQIELRVPQSIEPDNRPSVRWPDGCRENPAGMLRCEQALAGQTLVLEWPLYNPSVTTLARYTTQDGHSRTAVLTPESPTWTVPVDPATRDVVRGYFVLGVEHILGGWDHLLFVAGLLLIARGWRALLLAVSGFTLAHSLTLSLAALGFVHVPIPPTEAAIALSILFLAREALQPPGRSLAQRFPLFVSALFGLLHGLGFAAALGEVGLPQREIAWALLFFNLGVEAGQLVFICVLLAATLLINRAMTRLALDQPHWRANARAGMAYLIGIPAAFWLLQRLPLQFAAQWWHSA
jgi:hydrogenase/urease accessory protein HupE